MHAEPAILRVHHKTGSRLTFTRIDPHSLRPQRYKESCRQREQSNTIMETKSRSVAESSRAKHPADRTFSRSLSNERTVKHSRFHDYSVMEATNLGVNWIRNVKGVVLSSPVCAERIQSGRALTIRTSSLCCLVSMVCFRVSRERSGRCQAMDSVDVLLPCARVPASGHSYLSSSQSSF